LVAGGSAGILGAAVAVVAVVMYRMRDEYLVAGGKV
jgi:hypothetical protein